MVKAARSDSLVERLDQLADVYGEVLLGLYDDLTDQRERTEAVAARADSVLGEARRIMTDMGRAADEARALEQRVLQLTPPVAPPVAAPVAQPGGPGTTAPAAPGPDPAVLARLEALEASAATQAAATPAAAMPAEPAAPDPAVIARLQALEASAATLAASVQERTDAAVARSEALTSGLDAALRAHVQQSLNDVRTEVQQTVTGLREHVRGLVDAASHGARPAQPGLPAAPVDREAIQVLVRTEIDARTATFAQGAEHAQQLAARLELIVRDAQQQLQDARSDRSAAAFALRESRAELDAAKRTLDQSDFSFMLDRLRRTERVLYTSLVLAIVAIAVAVWALIR
jgi:hypothetical protein